MPKVRRVESPSINRTRSHPYPSNSKNDELLKSMNLLASVDEMKEWEDARCPICMEPPHNAVLLKCSSHEMGCRPYMCNTSYRHSNCLDQFCKSFASHLSSTILQEIPLTSATSPSRDVQPQPGHSSQHGSQLQPNLICPLCRGGIFGYMVLEPARMFMNSKPRSCSSETCEFQGTYPELRKHARSEHPSVRPSEVDPSRQGDWLRMERERDLEDLFSTIRPSATVEYDSDTVLARGPSSMVDGDSIWTWGLADLMSFFLYEIFSSIEDASRMTNLLSNSRHRVPLHDRRSGTMHRISNDLQTNQSARWRSNLPSAHQLEGIQRGRWRNNSSSWRDQANRTARWRTSLSSWRSREANRPARWRTTNLSSSRMPREVHEYYRELSPTRTSSRVPLPPLHAPQQTSPQVNTSSSGRTSGNSSSRRIPGHQLRWRDQRWSTYNNNHERQ